MDGIEIASLRRAMGHHVRIVHCLAELGVASLACLLDPLQMNLLIPVQFDAVDD